MIRSGVPEPIATMDAQVFSMAVEGDAESVALAGTRSTTRSPQAGDAVQVAGDQAEPVLEVLRDRAAGVSGGPGDDDHRSSLMCSATRIAMLYLMIDYRYTDW